MAENRLVRHRDLREYLEILDEHGDLQRAKRPVDPAWEMSAVLGRLEEQGDLSAVLFEAVQGLPGWRVVSNLFARRRHVALALNVPEEEILRAFQDRIGRSIPPRPVSEAPVKDQVLTGESATLDRLPLVHHHEKDVARYISAGLCISKDPDTGAQDMGVYRFMVKDEKTLVPSLTQTSRTSRSACSSLAAGGSGSLGGGVTTQRSPSPHALREGSEGPPARPAPLRTRRPPALGSPTGGTRLHCPRRPRRNFRQ